MNGLCKNNKCLNDALCIPNENGYNCSCKTGYMGQYCEKGKNHVRLRG